MAKNVTVVDRQKLVNAIHKAEINGALKNLDLLWIAACEIYNFSNPPKEITKSVVMLRAKEWKIETKTKPGKKGRASGIPLSDEQKAAMQAGRGVRKSRSEKFSSNPKLVNSFKLLRKQTPERYSPLINRIVNKGSMKAAVTLKCLECSAYQPSEIKLCVCTSCPLYAFRPYQGKLIVPKEDSDEVSEAVELPEVA